MTRTLRFVGILVALALFLAGTLVGWRSVPGAVRSASSRPGEMQVLWEVWTRLELLFWKAEQLDPERMVHGAIQGVITSLGDPHSTFLEPAQHRLDADRLQGEFGGIGAEFSQGEEGVVVLSVHPDSPAEAAGVIAGDTVLAVDGASAVGLAVDDVRLLVRGQEGTLVELTLQRDLHGVVGVHIERQRIEVDSVQWELVTPTVGYVHIAFFSDRTSQELGEALLGLREVQVQGLVLDLRGNGGGTVGAASDVLGQLLGRGIAYRELAKGAPETRHSVPFDPEAVDYPIAVLVDSGTASAAELVAAALQDNDRALLYGQPTFGKGSVQGIFPLEDGSSLHLTVARWLTSDGHEIEGFGLVPDVRISALSEVEEDLALQAAVADLDSGLARPSPSAMTDLLCDVDAVRER